MTRLDVTLARQNFFDTLNRVAYGGERIMLVRYGRPIAALVPPDLAESDGAPGSRKGTSSRRASTARKR